MFLPYKLIALRELADLHSRHAGPDTEGWCDAVRCEYAAVEDLATRRDDTPRTYFTVLPDMRAIADRSCFHDRVLLDHDVISDCDGNIRGSALELLLGRTNNSAPSDDAVTAEFNRAKITSEHAWSQTSQEKLVRTNPASSHMGSHIAAAIA